MIFADIISILPIGIVAVGMLISLMLGLFWSESKRAPFFIVLNFSICLIAWGFSFSLFSFTSGTTTFNGILYADAFTGVWNTILLLGTALVFLLSYKQLAEQKIESSTDATALIFLSLIGGMVMVSAADMMVLFVGFELMSVASYVLTGAARSERISSEAALKYFILGAFSSAFLLYGLALIYAATGTLNIAELSNSFLSPSPILLCGLGLLIFGFGFKVSLVPFHFWTPDAYHGAPTTIAAFMAVVVKAAAFGAFLRIMLLVFGDLSYAWEGMIWLLAVLTMTIGNVVALRQQSVKRMLAYSSIAHAGYALIGFLVFRDAAGAEAVIFYMFVYSIMTIAAFGVLQVASIGSDMQYEKDDFQSLSGLGWTHPLLGITMAVAMLSLAGMPPFAGFMAKFYLFSAAIQGGFVGIAIIAALNSVISLYYYLRVVVVMYFKDRSPELPVLNEIATGPRLALSLAVLGMVYFGIFSAPYYDIAVSSIESLAPRSVPMTELTNLSAIVN